MEWTDWVPYLEELIGVGSESKKISLLVPKSGEPDLTTNEAQDLSNAVHKKLFSSYFPARQELRILAKKSAKESFPLLYFSAWLVRNLEDTHTFWPPFCDAVVRDTLAIATVQSQLASLITDLWRKAHQEFGIYRPQEGYVNIKWPQAHAGLTQPEITVISNALTKHIGWSEEIPDILYIEPDDFLGFLRLWLQREYHVPRRLNRLIFGPDGPALVVSELVQRSLLNEWPPEKSIPERSSLEPNIEPPYLSINPNSLELQVVLPEGESPNYSNWKASYNNQAVILDTSYFERENKTRFKQYEWGIDSFPWSRQLVLKSHDLEISMSVSPECPFSKSRQGALMFDFNNKRYVKRWRPYRQYFLLIKRDNLPNWVMELFSDIEIINVIGIGEYSLSLLSVIGRDIISELGEEEATALLRRLEEILQQYGALISLPDIDELLQPELIFCGGLPTNDGYYATYLEDHPPTVLIRNASGNEINLSIYKREDEGSELPIASMALSKKGLDDKITLQLPQIDGGLYIIKGIQEPRYLRLVSRPGGNPRGIMEININLSRSENVLARDDIRHFENEGILITGWPNARVYFTVSTESGTHTYPVHLDEKGEFTIQAYDVELNSTTKFVRLKASSWLAQSESVDFTVRPYVPPGKWSLTDKVFKAEVRGVEADTQFRLSLIPARPWVSQINETHGALGPDFKIQLTFRSIPDDGWLLLSSEYTNDPWLISRIGKADIRYNISDFSDFLDSDFDILEYLETNVHLGLGIEELICLFRVVKIARNVFVPFEESPISKNLQNIIIAQDVSAINLVRLPTNWRGKKAEISSLNDNYAILIVDDENFRVHLTTSAENIKVTWAESSPPCICMHCGKVMTQEQWHNHQNLFHINSLQVLNREFAIERLIDWPSVMKVIKKVLLKAIVARSSKAPNGLEHLWATLQNTYKSEGSSEGMPPEEWIEGVFNSWNQLYDLVNKQPKINCWESIWEEINKYKVGLDAIGEITTL